MRLARGIAAFARAPSRRKALALEAVVSLLYARTITLLPARVYTGKLGQIGDARPAADAECPDLAREIGGMVAAVAEAMPFRAVCLQQALAASRMLRRRDMQATVCLGLTRSARATARMTPAMAAHAWVEVGSHAVTGGKNLDSYAIIARFG